MNMLKQLNDAMAYLEECLPEQVDMAKLARIAGCSEYHFSRMFSFLAQMPLGEYIRRRRLTLAGRMLQAEHARVIDVALQLGYDSPEAFGRAFVAMHGVTPSAARKGAPLKAFAPMTFQLTIKGGEQMQYQIVHKEAFNLVGFKKRITAQFEGVNPQMAELVQKLTPPVIAQLKALCDSEPRGILSVSANFSERTSQDSTLDQYLAVATTQQPLAGFDSLAVAAGSWAVFSVVGSYPQMVQQTWAKIFSEWLPASGYTLAQGPEMLWNEGPDISKTEYKSAIWIPVIMPEQIN